jgi:phosphatidylglycerophosphatase A
MTTTRANQISRLHIVHSQAEKRLAPLWARAVATLFGIGYVKPGPGTWGSLTTALLWFAAGRLIMPKWQPAVVAVAAVMVTVVGIVAASKVASASGNKDPQYVVIDEVAGQLIAFIAVPLVWKAALASFILFRIFDMVKPPPVRQLERLPGGSGIVMDDVAAGIYALVVVQLLLRTRLLG